MSGESIHYQGSHISALKKIYKQEDDEEADINMKINDDNLIKS